MNLYVRYTDSPINKRTVRKYRLASDDEILAVVRRGVESGTIKGEVVEAETLLQSGWFVKVTESGTYLAIPLEGP